LWLASTEPLCLAILGFLGSQRLSSKRNLGYYSKMDQTTGKGGLQNSRKGDEEFCNLRN
jgi:hypothetical protein